MSTLKQVLEIFQGASQPLSSKQIAKELGIEPAVLDDMIAFWVRKGKLRDVNACTDTCQSCGTGAAGCPFVVNMPKQYQLVMPE